MKKKRPLIILVVVLIVVIIILILFMPRVPEYSDEPRTWVEEKENIKKISTDKVTKGKGHFDDTSEQYKDINAFIETAFSYTGIYKGNGFFKEKYYARVGGLEELVMEITPEFDSTDGVLQGIIIERIENDIPEAFIFLDEDWKKQFSDLYIVWGANYQNEKKFEFNDVGGVYMDHVVDDKDRFTSDSYSGVTYGGIVVGDLTKEDIQNGNTNGTMIMLT